MCFSEKQSYINFVLLILGALYKRDNWRIMALLVFLSLKDLIQGLLYRYKDNKNINNKLTVLSWVHIAFQPLFVNIFISNFSKNDSTYWNSIFLMCSLYACYLTTVLDDLDIQNDPDCVSHDNDFCAEDTLSYQGRHHIAYRFKTDKDYLKKFIGYYVLMFLPALLTSSIGFGILWYTFVGTIYMLTRHLRIGEFAAIWCFSSIFVFLPIGLLEKKFV